MEIHLIIKAPNQKVPDQSLTCGVDWTVRQLKEHIANQYPTKPPVDEQRLIFAGAYLTDDSVLAEALRQKHQAADSAENDVTSETHTVHLVCLQDAPARVKPALRAPSAPKAPDERSIVGEDGLRRRINSSGPGLSSLGHDPEPLREVVQHLNQYRSQVEAQQAHQAAMQWYMEHYRPYYEWYYRTYYGFVPPELTTTTTTPATTQEAAQPPAEARIAAPNNNMRMDAQGNAFLADDDEEENGGRDWDLLDWIYTIARMAVFLSIIYFYSNMFRFALVVVCAFLMQYLHQAFRRPAPAAAEQAAVAPPAQPVLENRADEDPGRENRPVPPNAPEASPPVTDPATTDETPRGIFAVWAFFSAFFSSLFPEVPNN